MISSLTITLGLFYLTTAAIASWVLRTSSASLVIKIIVPTLIVVLACSTYLALPTVFGYPVEMAFAALPQQAELISFVPHDETQTVDLWLQSPASGPCGSALYGDCPHPRAYEVILTEDLKKTLRQAQEAQGRGERTMLAKGVAGKSDRQGYIGIDGGEAPYVLLKSAFALPAKGASQ